MLKRNIEYYGRNIFNGQLLTEKYYYHWNEGDFIIPEKIKEFLKPFDYCIRNNGYSFSVSSFIKECNYEKLTILLDYAINECGLIIDRSDFMERFLIVADISNKTHYDPIVSIKYNDSIVTGMSFYVSALKDKSLMLSYLDIVKQTFILKDLPDITSLIENCVISRCSDIFLVSWDFGIKKQNQNKIYLKIKEMNGFLVKVQNAFHYVPDFVSIDGYRFSELAFVINNQKFKMLNLYFKPA